ncbi:kinesin-like protein KIF3B [Eucyclogobius newberryi]|uniref:kinesin-like protein KIF3B n=1 Tax=Eucyclogobius newberryi TaxID=166745 RepID=UPI003B59BFF1
MSKGKSGEAVRVVVRCRPFTKKEEKGACENVLDVDLKLGQIAIRNPRAPPEEPLKVFTFDAVYGWSSTQRDVYDDAVRPLVESVLRGFNGTIFAYGQTGTGKTHTMEGVAGDPERRGVIPNSFQHVFTQISRTHGQKYLVRSSYLEIYREEIRDLLCKDNSARLELKESPDSGVYVGGLSTVVTKNAQEIEHVMRLGNQSRSVGFTRMNERSSRSHAIFVVTVECSEPGPDGEERIRVGKLNMVDLAGSERQSRTGAGGARLKEAAKINLSLSALGNVISALVDARSTHVPYRDSKLTRLLQDSLGGNAKTVMLATVGPSHRCYAETLATLRYASRAKNIKNKPRVNEDPKDALLREFQAEIARLKEQLEARVEERRRRRHSKRLSRCLSGMEEEAWREEAGGGGGGGGGGEEEKAAVCSGNQEKLKHLSENRKSLEDLQWDQDALEKIIQKYKAMESKLLIGGKTIIDHTNEQQKTLERRRQQIAEQIRRERVIQQQMMLQDEETLEMKETFSTLQQEVELKTRKLRRLFARVQAVKVEMKDIVDEHVTNRQELEQTQLELTRELKYKYLLIENFIPPEEKDKLLHRMQFDRDEDQWRRGPVLPSQSAPACVKRRPLSAVGYKRPISQHAQMAVTAATGTPFRYQAENILLLDLDMGAPAMFTLTLDGERLERAFSPRLLPDLLTHVPLRPRTSSLTSATRVRKSQSWYQAPDGASVPSSSSTTNLSSASPNSSPASRQRPSSAAYISHQPPLQP